MAPFLAPKRIRIRFRSVVAVVFCILLAYVLIVPDPQYEQRAAETADTSGDPRGESRTYTTFPEWYIVYSAQEYARFVAAGHHPTDFPYFRAIAQYWDTSDAIIELAGGDNALDDTTRTILNTIGWSYSLESGAIGLYETSIGRLFDYLNFRQFTVEDHYTAMKAEDYGNFLVHTPWFAFPYRQTLGGLWHTYGISSLTPRGLERRLSFTIGYTLKASYGRLINYLSHQSFGGALPYTTLTVESEDSTLLTDVTGVTILSSTATSTTVRLPRYRALLTPLQELAARGVTFKNIEGNTTIMLSVLAPTTTDCPWLTRHTTHLVPELTTDTARFLLVTSVPELPGTFTALTQCHLTVEHIYDY